MLFRSGHTPPRRGQGGTRAWGWCGPTRPPPGVPFWLLESSGAKLRKITSFVDSENISFVTFLESKKQKTETGTVASCQYVSGRKSIKTPRSTSKT